MTDDNQPVYPYHLIKLIIITQLFKFRDNKTWLLAEVVPFLGISLL